MEDKIWITLYEGPYEGEKTLQSLPPEEFITMGEETYKLNALALDDEPRYSYFHEPDMWFKLIGGPLDGREIKAGKLPPAEEHREPVGDGEVLYRRVEVHSALSKNNTWAYVYEETE